MSVMQVIFYFLLALSAISAIGVLFMKKVMNAALCLIVCMLGIAGVYVFAKADFIAVTQILVYVGGVLVLLVFGIMLSSKPTQNINFSMSRNVVASLVGVALFGLFSLGIYDSEFDSLYKDSQVFQEQTTTKVIGMGIMTDFILPFEIAAFLLLVALIAAVYIAGRKEEINK